MKPSGVPIHNMQSLIYVFLSWTLIGCKVISVHERGGTGSSDGPIVPVPVTAPAAQQQVTPFRPSEKCPPGTDIEDHRCATYQRTEYGKNFAAYRVMCTTTFSSHLSQDGSIRRRPRMQRTTITGSCPDGLVCMPYGPVIKSKRRRNDLRPPMRIACVPRALARRAARHRSQRPVSAQTVAIEGRTSGSPIAAAVAIQPPATSLDDDWDWSFLDELETVPGWYDDADEHAALTHRRNAVASGALKAASSVGATDRASPTSCEPSNLQLTPYKPSAFCPPGTWIEDHRCTSMMEDDLRPSYAVVCTMMVERWNEVANAMVLRHTYQRLVGRCPKKHVCVSLNPMALRGRRRAMHDQDPPTRIACVPKASFSRAPPLGIHVAESSTAATHRCTSPQIAERTPIGVAHVIQPPFAGRVELATPETDEAAWADSMILEHAQSIEIDADLP